MWHPSPYCPGVLVGPLAQTATSSADVSRFVKQPSDFVSLTICTSLMVLLISLSSLAGGSPYLSQEPTRRFLVTCSIRIDRNRLRRLVLPLTTDYIVTDRGFSVARPGCSARQTIRPADGWPPERRFALPFDREKAMRCPA